MISKKSLSLLVVSALSVGLVGCSGGGGSSTTATATTSGNFKDANVIGVEYKSGAISGLTGANGSYTCENGKNVTFSIGKVVLGSVPCGTLITPIDLITNSDINNTAVLNIVRLLTALDDDNNVSNGMNITSQVRTLANSWNDVNFSSTNFSADANVSTILSSMQNNIGGVHTLPTATAAKAHMKSTLLCAYSGAFSGSYAGSDNGGLGVMVSPTNGKMTVVGYSNGSQAYFSGTGAQSFGLDSTRATGSVTANSVSFNGNINTANSASGAWSGTGISGTWQVSRIGGVTNAKYRAVGHYLGSGGAVGLFSFDIDTSNAVTGIAYNTLDKTAYNITGTFSNGTDINATASDGTVISANFNPTTGAITNAAFSNTTLSTSGTFSGSGCTLN